MTQIPILDQARPDNLLGRFVNDMGAATQAPLMILGKAWRYGARFCARLAAGRTIEPPTTEEIILARYRRMARRFLPSDLTAEAERGRDDGFGLTEEDVLGGLGAGPHRTRFLGYYSREGVELTLERSGMLDRLRALGFEPWLEMDLDSPVGETLRLFGSPGRSEPLSELRVARDPVAVPGFDMLHVEWLMIQNLRSDFPADRPALPGQRHPGLGLLREVASLLILVCDRLGLDGLHFVPSHFHLGAQSRKDLRFVRPGDEARFRAMCDALGGLPLGAATRAVAAGRVRDGCGEPVAWRPVPMVLPVSERLRARAMGGEYEAEVAAAAGRFRYRLEPAVATAQR